MKDEFALVLLDVSMPGMDGFETAAMIHDHPRFERTPIIFVTGVHDTEFDRLKGYKLGAVDYVSIPVVPEILRSKVSVLVELHCQRLRAAEAQPQPRGRERAARAGQHDAAGGKDARARGSEPRSAESEHGAGARRTSCCRPRSPSARAPRRR